VRKVPGVPFASRVHFDPISYEKLEWYNTHAGRPKAPSQVLDTRDGLLDRIQSKSASVPGVKVS
jgi:hypothetical protein